MALTGTGIRIGTATEYGVGLRFPRALASDGTQVILFGSSKGYLLDAATGAATEIGTIDNFGRSESQCRSATYHNGGFVFWGNSRKTIYNYDPSDGSTSDAHGNPLTIQGTNTNPDLWGIASLNGTLYALDRVSDKLYTVDLLQNVIIPVGDATDFGLAGSPNIQGFAAYNGELIGASTGLDQLVRFNAATGVATAISTLLLPDTSSEALVDHAGQLLMAGSAADALFRLYDVLWDEMIADLEVDEGDSATWSLSGISQDAASFALQGTPLSWLSVSGTNLAATTAPDVNADQNHDVQVRATRDGKNVDKTLRVVVRNTAPPLPNNAPVFGEAAYAFTDVAIAVDTVVGTVAATDADNDDIAYSLTGADAGNFAIGSSGQITVDTALGHSATYNFNVVADDGTDNTSVGVSVATVAPPPNNAPVFGEAAYAFTGVAVAVNTVVGTVAATDADDDIISYSLTGIDADDFDIDSSGQITVATELNLSTTYNLSVVAGDGTDDTSVAVSITTAAAPPPPNNAPVFGEAAYAFTDVAIAVNTVVGAIVATDDDNDTILYSLTGVDASNFAIDANGQITVEVSELTHDQTYNFNGVADDGTDDVSVAVSVTAAAAPPPPVVITLTGAPTGLEVELTPTTALLKWAAATEGGDAEAYEVNVAEGASLGSTWVATGSTSTRFFVKRLKRGTQYTFGVRGRNSAGAGDASNPVTQNTPIASLHNALFFKECVNYFDNGGRVSVHGNPSNIIRAVADNNYKTFTTEKDMVINIAIGGNPTRIDAIFVKGIDIEGHSAEPTGGTGVGYNNRGMPSTVKNWEGTDVSTIVNGFQHDLYLLDSHFTATSVRMTFTGANAKITEIMLLEFGLEIDSNADFTQINPDFVDRSGVVHPDVGDGIAYSPSIGNGRDKWEIDYVVKVVPGKTLLETPEEFLYWRSENRNHVHAQEPSRKPWRIFPAVFLKKRVPVRLRTDDKLAGEVLNFRVAEQ